jgi:hypothetical protein
MITFTLILFFHVGVFGDTDSNATTVVPNFISYEECVAAGNSAKTLVRGTKKEVEYVCVKQTVQLP